LSALDSLYERYRDQCAFFFVYVREAHPEDGWVLTENRRADVAVVDPSTEGDRVDVATVCAARYAIRMPIIVDGVDDDVTRAYGAWPERLYLVGEDGRVAYQGPPGPYGFDPSELEAALESYVALASPTLPKLRDLPELLR
jgi:hypothetical protein